MSLRIRLRRTWFGLSTLFGASKGFFIPYRYAGGIATHRTYAAVEALLARHEDAFAEMLARMDAYGAELKGFAGPPPVPRWDQDWFPRLDGAAAYTILRDRKPRRVVEIGSGHSTRFMMQAVQDGGSPCIFTAIDPAPRADIRRLPLTHIPATLQNAERSAIAALGPGDVLFIDSSHILMPGTDVDLLLTEILPTLPAGVLVHIHDMLLPDDYPEDWAWRGYNEQSAIVPLLAGGAWQPLFASHYVATRMGTQVAASAVAGLPLPAGALETSLWLEKRA